MIHPDQFIKDTKLYYIFSKLKRSEHTRLHYYLLNPDIQRRKGAKLLTILTQRAIDGKWKSTTLGDLLAAIQGKRTANQYNSLIKEMSYAKDLLLQCFPVAMGDSTSSLQSVQTLEELFNRNGTKYFEYMLKIASKQVDNPENDAQFASKFSFELLRYQFELQEKGRKPTVNLNGVLQSIDLQFVFQKLKYSCIALNQDRILATQHDYGILSPILKVIENQQEQLTPILQAYASVYYLLTDQNSKAHFLNLKKILQIDSAKLKGNRSSKRIFLEDQTEKSILHKYFENHCIRKINLGDLSFLPELACLYKSQLSDHSIMNGQNSIEPETFKNITVALAENGDLKAASQFVETYSSKLTDSGLQKPVYLFCTGIVYFFQGKFNLAKKTLEEVLECRLDIFLDLDTRSWLLKINAETRNYDQLTIMIQNFRVQIDRKRKILKTRINRYAEFRKFMQEYLSIIECTPEKRVQKLGKLREAMVGKSSRFNCRWLQKKLASDFPG